MLGLRKKSFAFGSPRYQRMKTPVSASALWRLSHAGLLIRSLYLVEKLFGSLLATLRCPHIFFAQIRHVVLRVRDIFARAPHAKAQLFGKQSVSQLQTLHRRKPLGRLQDFLIGIHAQSLA